MAYSLALVDYKSRILLANGTYKGIVQTEDGWVVQDLNRGVNFGIYGSLEKALIMAHAYKLNVLSEAPQPAHVSNTSDSPMPTPIEAPATPSTTTPEMSFEAYCALFANPKAKSGFKYIADFSESKGHYVLKEGRSVYGTYATVEDALQDGYKNHLNL